MESVHLGDRIAKQIQSPMQITAVSLRPMPTGRARRWSSTSAEHRAAKASGYCMRLGMANRRLAPY